MMKKMLLLAGTVVLTLLARGTCCNAEEYENDVPVEISSEYEDVLGYAQYSFYDDESVAATHYDIRQLAASKSSVVLETNTCVEFVDIVGTTVDGQYVNLSNEVEVAVGDTGVATYEKGRIYGVGIGTTVIKVSYDFFEATIYVTVENYFDFEALVESMISDESGMSPYSVPGAKLQDVMNRAHEMCTVEWVTKAKFILNDGTEVEAGNILRGLPYTQLGRCSVADFLYYNNTWQDSGFYTFEQKDNGKYWSAYGIDCSGFLCNAWNLPAWKYGTTAFWNEIKNPNSTAFEMVGVYSYLASDDTTMSADKTDLKVAYASLGVGDAVVQRRSDGKGHARLVMTNFPSQKKVTLYEAFGNFPTYTTYTYDQLANDHYCPFAIKNSHYNEYN